MGEISRLKRGSLSTDESISRDDVLLEVVLVVVAGLEVDGRMVDG